MAYYSRDFVDLVNSRTVIAELMREEGEQVVGNGNTISFACPMCGGDFENGKIKVSQNFFKCFRCPQVHGSKFQGFPVNYMMLRHNYGFTDAVEYLAKRANIPLQESRVPEPAMKVNTEKSKLYNEVKRFFSKYAMPATEYLVKRGVHPEKAASIVNKYEIGYAPGGKVLCRHLAQLGYTETIMRKYNLLRDSGQDRFFFRLIVPLTKRGETYDFYTRRVDDSKHLKHLPLEGAPMEFGSEHIPKYAPVVDIYESVLNKLVAESVGFPNGIAIGGISKNNLKDLSQTLKRIRPQRIRLILDADSQGQGQNAAFSFGQELVEAGFKVEVVMLPVGQDVADLFANGQGDVFEKCLSNAMEYAKYRNHFLLKDIPTEEIIEHMKWRKINAH